MMQKLKAVFDLKATWLAIGGVVGTVFGDQAALAINAIGAVVMAVL